MVSILNIFHCQIRTNLFFMLRNPLPNPNMCSCSEQKITYHEIVYCNLFWLFLSQVVIKHINKNPSMANVIATK